MTIGKKFATTCALLITLSTVTNGISLYGVSTGKAGIRKLSTGVMPGIMFSDRVLADALELRVGYWRHIALTDPDAKAQIERNAEGIKKQITDDLASYESQVTEAEDRSEVDRIKAALNRYYQTWDALQPLSRDGKTAEVVALAPQAFTPAFNERREQGTV
jgi:hypothetical protein